ncbi:MAG: hypothetical protein EXR72_20615 [Myxococcales bacterium]|nr:hypothetical protein [Myxococcales bacterium]
MLAAAALSACYNPKIGDGQYSCVSGSHEADNCPAGLSCSACGVCRNGGKEVDDRPACPSGCTNNGGRRATGDPGLPRVAFCPAAWSVAGIVSGDAAVKKCGGKPDANGTGCTPADNCATGWHVCTGDKDALDHGLTVAACQSAPAGMYATGHRGGLEIMGPGMRAPSCNSLGGIAEFVMGCGTLGTSVKSCSILQHAMGAMECTGVWSCGSGGMALAGDLVKKSGLELGGVICCQD